ncbi:rhomboid family intramembrane serine protease [Bounagaea algeriensis]
MSVPPGTSPQSEAGQQLPGCVRHPDRPTGLRCTRCERPVCPDCLREASVGYHCVDCVDEGRRRQREPKTVAGAQYRLGRPFVVLALIVLNVGMFVLTAVVAGSAQANLNSQLGADLAMVPLLTAQGQWWRLVTSGFLHFGLVHLAMNMIALWVIGRDLEVVLGRLRFLAVYVLGLLGGSVAVFVFGQQLSMMAGASGAVYGLMGGIALVALRLKISLRPVITVIVLNLLITFTIPQISVFGHLGGLVLGSAATAALVYAPQQRRTLLQASALGGLLVLLVALIVTRDAQLAQTTVMVPGSGAST